MLCAFQGRCDHCGHDHGNPFDLPNMTTLSETIRQQQATIDRLTERQNADDKRIQQLLAVIELQRQALIAAQNAIGEYDYTGTKEMSDKYIIAERLCAEALAIKPQDVELVEVGEADFDKPAGTVNLDIYNIDFDGLHNLYTIKTKG